MNYGDPYGEARFCSTTSGTIVTTTGADGTVTETKKPGKKTCVDITLGSVGGFISKANVLSRAYDFFNGSPLACADLSCPDNVLNNDKVDDHEGAKPAPDSLPAFPDAKKTKKKTSVKGGGSKRPRWKDRKGKIYEWDSKKGEVEVYGKGGRRHEGGFDPDTGRQISRPVPGRTVEP